MKATISFGSDNSLTRTVAEGATVGSLVGDPIFRQALGYGDKVEGHVGGVPVPARTPAYDGIEIEVYSAATEKA